MKQGVKHTKIQRNLPMIIFQFFALIISINAYSQENPWETETSGTNPWTGEVVESEHSDSSVNVLPLKEISSQELTYVRELELTEFGKTEYNAPFAAVFSGLTSTVFSVFAIPVNLIATSVIPTPQGKQIIADYKQQHPDASRKEIKLLKKGITKKRYGNSLKGSAVGCGINLLAILGLSQIF